MPLQPAYQAFWACSFLLVTVGVIKDAGRLSLHSRFIVKLLLVGTLVTFSGVHLVHASPMLGLSHGEWRWVESIVTVVAIMGAMAAFRMTDGLDGLLGSLALIALVSLIAIYASSGHLLAEVVFALGLALALMAYLLANLRVGGRWRCKILMGNAGSTFIGLSIVWLAAKGTNPDVAVIRPVLVLWVIAVPLMDMMAVTIRRLSQGRAVTKPGRDHIHHVLIDNGFNDREALILITLVAMLMAFLGLVGELFKIPNAMMFLAFLMAFTVYEAMLRSASRSKF